MGRDARSELAIAVPDASFAERVLLRMTPGSVFEREAARAEYVMSVKRYETLSHSSLVQVYSVFSENSDIVVVMEYVEGLALDEVMRALVEDGRSMPDVAAFFVGVRVVGALAAAHAARDPQTSQLSPIIHGEVRPEVVLIPWDGYIRLAEYRAAKCAPVYRKLAAGPNRYAAPEQAREGKTSAQSDVYSAALIVWELFARRQAFPVSLQGPELLRAMGSPQLPSLASLRPDLPKKVVEVIDEALEPRPELRTITAVQLLATLRGAFIPEQGEQWFAMTMPELRDKLKPPKSTPELAPPIESSGPVGLLKWAETVSAPPPASRTAPFVKREASPSAPRVASADPSPPSRGALDLPASAPRVAAAPRPRIATRPLIAPGSQGTPSAPQVRMTPGTPPGPHVRIQQAPMVSEPPIVLSDFPQMSDAPLANVSDPPIVLSQIPMMSDGPSALDVGVDALIASALREGQPPPIPTPLQFLPVVATASLKPAEPASPFSVDTPFGSLPSLSPRLESTPPTPRPPSVPPEDSRVPSVQQVRPNSQPPRVPSQRPPAGPSRLWLIPVSMVLVLAAGIGVFLFARMSPRRPSVVASRGSQTVRSAASTAPALISSPPVVAASSVTSGVPTVSSTTSTVVVASTVVSAATSAPLASITVSAATSTPLASMTATSTPIASGTAAMPGDVDAKHAWVVTSEASPGHRIFIDGRVVGQTPDSVIVVCGLHNIKIGSAGGAHQVMAPCGGSVSVKH